MDKVIEEFIEKIKSESVYSKIISDKTIEDFNKLFIDKILHIKYDKTIDNPV